MRGREGRRIKVPYPTFLAIGGALGVFMGRRGFDAYSWFVLGTILGPLAVFIAVLA